MKYMCCWLFPSDGGTLSNDIHTYLKKINKKKIIIIKCLFNIIEEE